MNYLVLGTEMPNYDHPILKKYNQPVGDESLLTEEERMLREIKRLSSDDYSSTIENLRLHYTNTLHLLQAEFNLHLSEIGVFNMPAGGLGAWIKFHKPMKVLSALPYLNELGIYNPDDNDSLDINMPIEGIRAGFGTHDAIVYGKTFKLLAEHLNAL